jgi:hypothetical protein
MAGYETSKFGNGVAVGSGGNVSDLGTPHNHFGPRDTDGADGVLKVEGITEQLIINFTGKEFNDGVAPSLVPYVIPAGSVIKAVYLDVEEVFVATSDTTFALEIGTDTTEVTNGFTTTEAQLEATDSVNLTSALSGTWDSEVPLAADTIVGAALSGTNSAVTDAGKARFTIVYDRVNLGL